MLLGIIVFFSFWLNVYPAPGATIAMLCATLLFMHLNRWWLVLLPLPAMYIGITVVLQGAFFSPAFDFLVPLAFLLPLFLPCLFWKAFMSIHVRPWLVTLIFTAMVVTVLHIAIMVSPFGTSGVPGADLFLVSPALRAYWDLFLDCLEPSSSRGFVVRHLSLS